MVCKIFLKPKNGSEYPIIPIVNQSDVNSFIYKTLGDNNKWHDAFSEYSISSIQGGKLYDKNYIKFITQPYIQIASECDEFLENIFSALRKRKYELYGMVYDRLEIFNDFNVKQFFDKVITISPVIVKDDEHRQISSDNERFVEFLKKNCVAKLKHHYIVDESFDIELLHPEKCKVKKVLVGKKLNIATMCLLKISGRKESRNLLYSLGLGGSTGSGFGAVKLYE